MGYHELTTLYACTKGITMITELFKCYSTLFVHLDILIPIKADLFFVVVNKTPQPISIQAAATVACDNIAVMTERDGLPQDMFGTKTHSPFIPASGLFQKKSQIYPQY